MKKGVSAPLFDRLITSSFRMVYDNTPVGIWRGNSTSCLPVVQTRNLTVQGWGHKVKIVHATDLHYDPEAGVNKAHISSVVKTCLAQKPDIILLTGDYIFDICRNPKELISALKPLSEHVPTYASLGNHDGGKHAFSQGGYRSTKVVEEILLKAGICLLKNQTARLTIKGNQLQLVGLRDLWAGGFSPDKAFKEAQPGVYTIVLSHNPDTYDLLKSKHWNLMLSGHTHGGQVILPVIGAPWNPSEKFAAGWYDFVDRQMHVSRGTGALLQMRVSCPAEISVINLS